MVEVEVWVGARRSDGRGSRRSTTRRTSGHGLNVAYVESLGIGVHSEAQNTAVHLLHALLLLGCVLTVADDARAAAQRPVVVGAAVVVAASAVLQVGVHCWRGAPHLLKGAAGRGQCRFGWGRHKGTTDAIGHL